MLRPAAVNKRSLKGIIWSIYQACNFEILGFAIFNYANKLMNQCVVFDLYFNGNKDCKFFEIPLY